MKGTRIVAVVMRRILPPLYPKRMYPLFVKSETMLPVVQQMKLEDEVE